MASPYTMNWRHLTITDAGDEGVVHVTSDQPFGTHAVTGGGWLGGPLTNTSTTGQDAVEPAVAGYFDYDAGTDTTYWHAVFKLPKGGTARCHVWSATT